MNRLLKTIAICTPTRSASEGSRVPSLALRVGVIFLALGCGQPTIEPTTSTKSASKTEAVSTFIQPQRKSLVRLIEQPGTMQAFEETNLFARLPGYISKVHVDIGQLVQGPKYDSAGKEIEPGQILGEISVPEMIEESNQKIALSRQAEANVDQAKGMIASTEASIAVAMASLTEAKALSERWESENKRLETLTKNGVIDAQTRDETLHQAKAAAARVKLAEANLRKSNAEHDKAKADLRSAEARVAFAEAEARRMLALLVYAKLRAPYDGIVTRRKVNTGDFVQPSNSKEDWLFTVARLDPVRVVISVPEIDAGLINDKSEIKLTIPALLGTKVSGTIARTSWALEPGTRTLRAEIDLPNRDGRYRPGLYVYARITCKFPDTWVLPHSAIVTQGETTSCFLVIENKAIRTAIQVGQSDGQFVQVLRRQTPGPTPSWEEWTGTETVIARAQGVSDSQIVASVPGAK